MQRLFSMWTAIFLQLGIALWSAPSDAAVANCEQIMSNRCHSEFSASKTSSHIDNYMESKDVYQCILRGYDAPINCRKDKGESPGVRVDGSSGFSYGTVQSPQNSPGNTNSPPTVTPKSIYKNLGFDYNNGCEIYGINLCERGYPPPPPLDMSKQCPEKDDPYNRLGIKTPVTSSELDLPCGAAVPLTNYEVSMNAVPTHVAVTEYKSYTLRMYQKSNGKYSLNSDYWEEVTVLDPPSSLGVVMDDKVINDVQIGPEDTSLLAPPRVPLIQHHLMTFRIKRTAPNGEIPLPGYLCGDQMSPVPLMVNPPRQVPETMKTVELTPTIAQMISLNPKDTINLRLMSRNTLKPYKLLDLFQSKIEYIYPPYWFGWPEHILYYWPEPPEPLDDEIEEQKLEKFLVLPMYEGLPVVPARQDTPLPPGQVKCGREARRENGTVYSFFQPTNKLSADILLEQPTTLCESTDADCNAMYQACLAGGGTDCSSIIPTPRNDLSCETNKLPLKKGDVPVACEAKMQWVVMDRHNMVYPVGTKVTPIPIDPGTNLMMPTVTGTRIFAQKDSNLRMGETAPIIRLEEGGTLLINGGSKLKMLPPAEIGIVSLRGPFRFNLSLNQVKLEGGGILIDNKGVMQRTYAKGELVTVPAVVLPYVINLNRSFTIPETYEYPSASKDPEIPNDPLPYAKFPLDANPVPEVVKFKPRILPGLFRALPRQPIYTPPVNNPPFRGPR